MTVCIGPVLGQLKSVVLFLDGSAVCNGVKGTVSCSGDRL